MARTMATKFQQIVDELLAECRPTTPVEWLEFEVRLHQRVARECCDPVTAELLQEAHKDDEVVARAELLARRAGLQPQRSSQKVRVTLLGGSTVELKTPYFLRRRERGGSGGRRGRPRKPVRGNSGNGLYPILAVLGIHFRATPALASEVARLVVQGTYQEARQSLAVRGIHLGLKEVARLTGSLAKRGLSYRDWAMKQAGPAEGEAGILKGKRVAIASDGGRLRVRQVRPGRRRKSGHHGFTGLWKEPKLLVIYELDAEGRKKRRGVVYYEGTMGDADRLFELLASALRRLGAHEAEEWVVLGDGALWIWNRTSKLAKEVGFDPERLTEVLDFYHASQRLHEIAAHASGLSDDQKASWVTRMRRLLKQGQVERLEEEARALCQGANEGLLKEFNYLLVDNRDRIRYADFRRMKVPLGSGVIESAVRRVINLRMKGSGVFWGRDMAEGVLHLRCRLLSGHWHQFVCTILQPEGQWDDQTPANPGVGRAS